ncbi:hypothetical protein [Modestobacter sp. VKM Ac-2985]|uniref:hypothetical protein n=1 Tax=Modestobacter sp. VKM Ac-2985 TaxID=3004139 RepID=UPI0022AB7ECC|nr:hypothetical protein [Modestobacter sp. VKM Ac-2985]MCZ2836246.1 hypothetical protein [Modestobacter sp. VKM Ac-2985]
MAAGHEVVAVGLSGELLAQLRERLPRVRVASGGAESVPLHRHPQPRRDDGRRPTGGVRALLSSHPDTRGRTELELPCATRAHRLSPR